MSDRVRVMVVDDHPIVRQGVRSLLSTAPDLALVAEAENAQRAVELALSQQPDVILLDVRMPGDSGVDCARTLRRLLPAAKILMLTSFDDDDIITQALAVGVHGYLLKSASDDHLAQAVRAAHRGERVLSPPVIDRLVEQMGELGRERALRDLGLNGADDERLLRLLVAGAGNAQMAAELHLSETSVKRRLQELFAKLGVATRAQAAAEVVRRGLV
jgi:DNA-binding NarL/FixJ family response regulator